MVGRVRVVETGRRTVRGKTGRGVKTYMSIVYILHPGDTPNLDHKTTAATAPRTNTSPVKFLRRKATAYPRGLARKTSISATEASGRGKLTGKRKPPIAGRCEHKSSPQTTKKVLLRGTMFKQQVQESINSEVSPVALR